MPKPIKFRTKAQRKNRLSQEIRLAVIVSLSVFVIGLIGWQFISNDEGEQLTPQSLFSAGSDTAQPNMTICAFGARFNCVVDGDTIWLRGEKIRVADIDTPEVGEPQCESEYQLGMQATNRLRELLNSGPFSVEQVGFRDEDQYGRKLRVLTRGGSSIGDQLVAEGLARTWSGRREPWC